MIHQRKRSAKRDAIFHVLKGTSGHPGAQWVYEKLKPDIPDLSLGTVYRNLSIFRKEGKAVSLGAVNGEERFDAVTRPHPHFICSCCGTVADLEPDYGEALVKSCDAVPRTGSVKHSHDAVLDEKPYPAIDFRRTLFYGVCRECRQNLSGQEPAQEKT